jgi:hypothetical protein
MALILHSKFKNMKPPIIIQSASGSYLDLHNLKPEDIQVTDIAHHLSHLCRFGGATFEFYSVAEHSIHVARIVNTMLGRPDLAMAALMHDASEAYLGDVRTPMKHMPEMAPYLKLEAEVQEVIHQHFGIPPLNEDDHNIIKQADLIMLATERRWFMPTVDTDGCSAHWKLLQGRGIEPLSREVWKPLGMRPGKIRALFLHAANLSRLSKIIDH